MEKQPQTESVSAPFIGRITGQNAAYVTVVVSANL